MSHIVLTVDGSVVFDNQAAEAPSTAQRLKDAIAQLRSQNVPWPDVGVYLQTWVLQRALSPAEWEIAYAAGFPRPAPPTPPAPPTVDVTVDPIDFNLIAGGLAIPLPHRIINCPPKVMVHVFYDSTDAASHYVDFNAIVNGHAVPCHTTIENLIPADSQNGEITVAADQPGQQMRIQSA